MYMHAGDQEHRIPLDLELYAAVSHMTWLD